MGFSDLLSGVSIGLRIYGWANTFNGALRQVQRLKQGAELRDVMLSVAADAAMNYAFNKAFGYALKGIAKVGGRLAARGGKAVKEVLHNHHVLPKFLVGSQKGITRKLSDKLHTEFHRRLYHNLAKEFKRYEGKYNRPFNRFRGKFEWKEILQNDTERMKMLQILTDTTAGFDADFGQDLLPSLFEELAGQL